MCLGIPGRIVETYAEQGLAMGRVDFGGVTKRVCLAHVPHAQLGDFVMVHVGFALSVIDPAEAAEVFRLLAEMGGLDELQGDGTGGRA